MIINKLTVTASDFPEVLRQIPSPPKQLYHTGVSLEELLERPRVAIVGSRTISPYGRQVTAQLAGQLAEQGVVIISGLALGVDGTAHHAALEAGGLTIAVLPGPLEKIVPSNHQRLAQQILEQGGALVSEYPTGSIPHKQNFIARNRLMSGLAQAVLITEAAERSGSLHTARFALEQGKDVLAVPGDITRSGSVGVNNLIKSGATPVTSYLDVLYVLGIEEHQTTAHEVRGRNAHEQRVLDLLLRGINEGELLLQQSELSASQFNQVLTMLEIGGKVRSLGANQWSLA
ncbi:MAG: DNA-processing protein DprA [Candidatus Saccharimonadales bacterium]